ncbi:MAG: WecB/TagA/CpsF family glycosyltransferase [Patescibacteria group bacterium]|nr:WecB/TagA/CpsF family glycosyltransferase [Patescibacteria group bacterium]
MGTSELKILGVRIDSLSRAEINDWIESTLDDPPEQKFVTTLNPEIILKAHRDEKYREILNSSDLALCDGFGINFVSWFKGRKTKARHTGVDLVDYSLKLAKEKNLDVLVVVSKHSLSSPEEIRRGIEAKYNFKAQALYLNSEIIFENGEEKSAQIVFVNFGASHQEKFIFENRMKFPNAKILVGVGGTFDFITGKIKRAPRWMQKAGLEWFWRFVQEPRRAKRIWNAVFVFPILAILKSK